MSKKDSTSIGHFGAAFSTGKPKETAQKPPEERKEAKIPVFTKKIKVTTEESQHVENIPKMQNYDFSKMKMSQASNKPTGPRPEGEQHEHREQREPHKPREFDGSKPARGEFGGRGRGRGGYDRAGDRAQHKDKESDDSFEEVKERRKPQYTRGGKNHGEH